MAKERKRRDPRWLTTAHAPREEERKRNDPRWLTTAHAPREEEEEQEWSKRILLQLEPVHRIGVLEPLGIQVHHLFPGENVDIHTCSLWEA